MGAAVVLNVVFVNDDPADIAESVGFSPNIFHGDEWETLKAFANKKNIKQKDLNRVFKRFLSHAEIYLRKFRVRYSDVKGYFMNHSRLMQDYRGLEKPVQHGDDVSFARFVIMGFIFNNQPIPDLIFDFVATLRMKLQLKLNMAIFRFNFEQIIRIMVEEITPCTTLSVILDYCNPQNDLEINVHSLMQMCLKYPLAFYSLIRFRNHFQRLIFGDKFWEGRKPLKSRFLAKMRLDGDYEAIFETEGSTRRETARALISDCLIQEGSKLVLDEELGDEMLVSISATAYSKVKSILGYKYAKGLIMEAELELEDVFPLFTGTELAKFTEQKLEHLHLNTTPYFDPLTLDGETEANDNESASLDSSTLDNSPGKKGKTAAATAAAAAANALAVIPSREFQVQIPEDDGDSASITSRASKQSPSAGSRSRGTRSIENSSVAERDGGDRDAIIVAGDKNPLDAVRLLDKKIGFEFVYSVETGEREWIRRYEDSDGSLLKETYTVYPDDDLIEPFRGRNEHPTTVLGNPLQRKLKSTST